MTNTQSEQRFLISARQYAKLMIESVQLVKKYTVDTDCTIPPPMLVPSEQNRGGFMLSPQRCKQLMAEIIDTGWPKQTLKTIAWKKNPAEEGHSQ